MSTRHLNSAHKSESASETSFSFTAPPSRSKISMPINLLRTLDLKELRNTQDLNNKKTAKNYEQQRKQQKTQRLNTKAQDGTIPSKRKQAQKARNNQKNKRNAIVWTIPVGIVWTMIYDLRQHGKFRSNIQNFKQQFNTGRCGSSIDQNRPTCSPARIV
jgi:hypothetical protein